MRAFYAVLAVIMIAICASYAYAVPPVVTENVPVLTNTDAAHCTRTYDGRGGSGITETTGAIGENNSISSPGIRSCTGCKFDPSARSCTCARCYDYFDD